MTYAMPDSSKLGDQGQPYHPNLNCQWTKISDLGGCSILPIKQLDELVEFCVYLFMKKKLFLV